VKVLIAGATGVIGPTTARPLVADRHEVIGLSRTTRRQTALHHLGVRLITANALDPAGIRRGSVGDQELM
jgi:nucleoside-diphosphate-sugar epimerase